MNSLPYLAVETQKHENVNIIFMIKSMLCNAIFAVWVHASQLCSI